jgi:hypothetical protein
MGLAIPLHPSKRLHPIGWFGPVDPRSVSPGVFPASAPSLLDLPSVKNALEVTSPSELDHRQATAKSCYSVCGASPEVASPSAHRDESIYVTCPGFCLARYVPSSGFLTLLTACSRLIRPTVVSSRSAHGVSSLQSFSLHRSRSASRRPLPSCRSDIGPTRRSRPKGLTWSAAVRDADFVRCVRVSSDAPPAGLCTSLESVVSGAAVKPSQRSLLSWD